MHMQAATNVHHKFFCSYRGTKCGSLRIIGGRSADGAEQNAPMVTPRLMTACRGANKAPGERRARGGPRNVTRRITAPYLADTSGRDGPSPDARQILEGPAKHSSNRGCPHILRHASAPRSVDQFLICYLSVLHRIAGLVVGCPDGPSWLLLH